MEAGQGFTVPRRSLGERSSLRGIGVTSGRDSPGVGARQHCVRVSLATLHTLTGYNLAGTGAMRCQGRAVEEFESELARRVSTRGGVTFSFAVLLCRIIRLGGSCSTAKRLGLRGIECR